jgi:3-hydroxyisobutyrate dehydrogenase
MKAAVIGLGSMGSGMASSLARAGFTISGFDQRPETLDRFSVGKAASSAREAALDAEVVVIVVVNAEQTETVLFDNGGVIAAMRPDAVVVSCATMAPDRARFLAAAVEATGRLYVDAPISGGAARAAEGELTILASGSAKALGRAGPALDAMSAKTYILGDEAGIGSSFKIVNQLLAGVHIAAACEAIVFAKTLGLNLEKVYEVITASAGNSWMFENRIPHVLDGDYSPRSSVEIFTKDLGIVSEISRKKNFATPIAASALQMFLMTASAGMAKDDDASVARLYSLLTGGTLP